MGEYTDHKILQMCRTSDSKNFGFHLLVSKYQKRIYWHVRRMVIIHEDADDIVQDVFVKVWKNLDSFREESNLYTWIYRIATNETLGFLRRKKIKYLFFLSNYEERLINGLIDDNYFSGDEIQKKLQKAILTLPEKQKLVFNMRYYEEMKYQDMSAILGTSIGALKASYHIAVKKIENYLKDF